jgi:acyl carrier protein
VKIGGIRIELDEIALALQRHPSVGSALVDAVELPGRGKVLAAYVVPRTRRAPAPTPLDLRRFLYRTLPRNYIPSFFAVLDAMPLTRNGKIDRMRLPKPELPTAGTNERRRLSLLETRVVEIMREALDLDTLGLDDNFFLLGGHSLVATRVIVRCRELLGVPIALRDLFEADSIGEFVEAIHDRLAKQLASRERRIADRLDAPSWA